MDPEDALRDTWGSSISPLIENRPRINNFSLVSMAISEKAREDLLSEGIDSLFGVALLDALCEHLIEEGETA